MGQKQNKNIQNNQQVSESLDKNSFMFIQIIGKGGFGKVWKVIYTKNKNKYAMKVMSKLKIIDKKSEKGIFNERNILEKIHHPYIYIYI